MYYENMRFGDYADINFTKAEMDRIYHYAIYKWIRNAKSIKEINVPWINNSSVDLYDQLKETWKIRKIADDDEVWLNDLVIQSLILILWLRYEKYN